MRSSVPHTQGWFVGTVHSRGPFTKADLKKVPTANFVVKYNPKITGGKLNGSVAHELSVRTFGVEQWWVQVEKDGSLPPPKEEKKKKSHSGH